MQPSNTFLFFLVLTWFVTDGQDLLRITSDELYDYDLKECIGVRECRAETIHIDQNSQLICDGYLACKKSVTIVSDESTFYLNCEPDTCKQAQIWCGYNSHCIISCYKQSESLTITDDTTDDTYDTDEPKEHKVCKGLHVFCDGMCECSKDSNRCPQGVGKNFIYPMMEATYLPWYYTWVYFTPTALFFIILNIIHQCSSYLSFKNQIFK